METRKVQVTGGSTFTVSIPKGWAKENDIEAGDRVEFFPDNDSLILIPKRESEQTEGTIDISGLEGDELIRAVMSMYVSGFDVIKLEADRISTSQRQLVSKATQNLVGLEVLEETSEKVIIQDLLDSTELSITNAVTRMRLVALSMLEDSIVGLLEDDDEMAKSVIDRDDDVDRLWMVVSRIFRESLRGNDTTVEIGIPREDCFDYHSSARQLERIADHATKIAHLSLELDEIPDQVADGLNEFHGETEAIIEKSMDALFMEDRTRAKELAHEARESVMDTDRHARSMDELLYELEPQQAQLLGLIVDSLSRSSDYGGNIAETALQKATPKP
ncbi:PhoU domain-containing protein [Halorussus sp. AFM4]|uniref:PhoU domain-containing protein n=1 Tax=Halorussus sp. AFM4 TaxID=3421651 RepID=UPI003EB7D32A